MNSYIEFIFHDNLTVLSLIIMVTHLDIAKIKIIVIHGLNKIIYHLLFILIFIIGYLNSYLSH